jgi:hypothetical protein
MGFKGRFTTGLAAVSLVVGGSLVTAPAAQAGPILDDFAKGWCETRMGGKMGPNGCIVLKK